MKLAAILPAVVFLIVAVVYLAIPADSLPSFFPGYDPSMSRVRLKHGMAAAGVALVLFLAGWYFGRKD